MVIKPVMEIMASLPSVVLGFLAALWLAPLIESRVPSILLAMFLVPLVALALGYAWSPLPIRFQRFVQPGYECLVFRRFCSGSWMRHGILDRDLRSFFSLH